MNSIERYDLNAVLEENRVGRKRLAVSMMAIPAPPHMIKLKENRLETRMPVIKLSEIHSKGMLELYIRFLD
jgi:hypothetical protein